PQPATSSKSWATHSSAATSLRTTPSRPRTSPRPQRLPPRFHTHPLPLSPLQIFSRPLQVRQISQSHPHPQAFSRRVRPVLSPHQRLSVSTSVAPARQLQQERGPTSARQQVE